MKIPRLDKRTASDIEAKIKELSHVYTPEWRFDPETPDMGTAAALIYAEMMNDIVKSYNQTTENNMIEFFSMLGAKRLPAEPAVGYASFGVSGSEENVPGEFVDKGTKLIAAGVTDSQPGTLFTTTEPVYVLNSQITEIFCESTLSDTIYQSYSASDNPDSIPENISLFGRKGENLQRHIFYFSAEHCMSFSGRCRMFAEFIFDNADPDDIEDFMRASTDEWKLSYSTENGFAEALGLSYSGNKLIFCPDENSPPARALIGGRESYWLRLELFDISVAEKLYIKDIYIGSSAERVPSDSVFGEAGELPKESFSPFDVNPIPYSSVYLVSDDIFSKKGADISVEFRIDYITSRINDDEEQEIDWKFVMKKSKLKKPKEYDVKIHSVVWEYYNGFGWIRLFPGNEYSDIFDGNNDASTVRISFKCPEDISKSFMPSGEKYAIRARILSVENFMKYNGRYITPTVSELRLSYSYSQPERSLTIITDNCMYQRLYDMSTEVSSIRLASRSKNGGSGAYFNFSAPPQLSGIKLLFVIDRTPAEYRGLLKWEYLSNSGWRALSLRDKTKGLASSGIIALNYNPGFAKTTLFGRAGYWIRAYAANTDVRGEILIKKICLNSVRIMNIEEHDFEYFYVDTDTDKTCQLRNSNVYTANVMVNEISELSEIAAAALIDKNEAQPVYDENGKLCRLWVRWEEVESLDNAKPNDRVYVLNKHNSQVIFGNGFNGKIPSESDSENVRIAYTTGGGSGGNLPEGSITATDSSLGMISSVTNPIATCGGIEMESVTHTVERTAEELRCRFQACTAFDYECIVKEYDRNIISVKCLCGVNPHGEKEYGAVTVVYRTGNDTNYRDSTERIKKHLLSVCCAGINPSKLYVIQPERLTYNILANIIAANNGTAGELPKLVHDKLVEYFSRHSDNEDELFKLPERLSLLSLISDLVGVERIESFYLTVCGENGEELTENELDDKRFAAAKLGTVDIRVNTE